jgi:voltage-gated potassium channel Kch
MLRLLLTGLPVLVCCLLLQAVFVAKCLRYYARAIHAKEHRGSQLQDIVVLSAVMLLTLLGNFIQMAIWAGLFMLLGEFSDFPTALYHSGVNFATLGYGDLVMSERWRLLGPLEAANGILMFGVSTAVMTAAVMDVIKRNAARRPPGEPASPQGEQGPGA